MVLFEEYQQLPEYYWFRNSVQRYYPDELKITDQELVNALFRVLPFIGIDIEDNYLINDRDMVLLLVLKDLFGDNSIFETSKVELTTAEKSFLNSRI